LFGKKITVTYIANSGVLVTSKKKQILIDGLHQSSAGFYHSTEKKTVEDIILGKAPFNSLDMLLFTHDHSDHFNAAYCREALKRNKHLQVVAPQSAAEKITSSPDYNEELKNQIKPIEASQTKPIVLSLKGIDIEVFSLNHDGASGDTTVNNAYLIQLGKKTMMFLGDAKADDSNFEAARVYGKPLDALFVPFTFIGLSAGREIIKKISPKKLIVVHLPDKDKDTNNLTEKTKAAYSKYSSDFPETVLFEKIGQQIVI